MHKIAAAAVVCALLGACNVNDVFDEIVLTEAEAQDLEDNFAAAIVAYQALGSYALDVALGNADVEGAEYTQPSAENGWTGTLTYIGDQFPGGDGDLSMSFVVSGDDGPADPYAVDLTTHDQVSISVQIVFTGVSEEGAPLYLDADFTLTALLADPDFIDLVMSGDFLVGHNDYLADFMADDFGVRFDRVTEQAVDASGRLLGQVDIPDFAFDADFWVTGMGESVRTVIQVASTTIEDTLQLSDF